MFYHKHIKERSYYEDLYDRGTVKSCLFHENLIHKDDPKLTQKENEEKKKAFKIASHLSIYFQKGERYLEREKTINEWMEKDRKLDEQFEKTTTPEAICQFCLKEMELFDKTLNIAWKKDEIDKVVFSFRCAECKIGKEIDEFGKVENYIPWKCPKCSRKMECTSKRKGRKISTKDHCLHCGYEKEDTFELGKYEPIPEINPEEEKQFRIDKDRFCLTSEDGTKYREGKESLKRLTEIVNQSKQKKEDEKKLSEIKKLKVLEMEKVLLKTLENSGYIRLTLGKSEIIRDVIMDFTVHDEKDRSEYDSKQKLRRLIKASLEGTNWKLMSEGLSYNLGVLSGRLRGYQHEEDLLKLASFKETPENADYFYDKYKKIKY